MDSPFVGPGGTPKLVRCAVLFVDLLGVREMAKAEDAADNLDRLSAALIETYGALNDPQSGFHMAVFSDSMAVAVPVSKGREAETLASLLTIVADIQLTLATDAEIFLRGGIVIGQLHMHNRILFGKGLVDAYELECKRAVQPRILIGESARKFAVRKEADLGAYLIADSAGNCSLNYLAAAHQLYRNSAEVMDMHREVVETQLIEHAGNLTIWEKYRWVAELHNHVCERFYDSPGSIMIDPGKFNQKFA